MQEHLQEFVDSRGVTLALDRQAGVIRGVKVLGLQSRNGRTYLPEALAAAVALYEGAKVNVDHPKGHPAAPRDYRDRLGIIRAVRATAEGIFADFHYNPKHPLAEQLAWDAEHAPENLGFSHNVEARASHRHGQTVVDTITHVHSVDLVADPATTRGLFEHQQHPGDPPMEITLEAVKAQPALIEALRAELLAEQAGLVRREAESAAELAQLRQELDALRAKEAAADKRAKIDALLAESRLPKETVTELLIEQLMAADEASGRRLIEDRQSIWRAAGASPKSRDQALAEGAAPADAKSFAAAARA